MRLNFIWRVAFKELLSAVRDRRAFRSSIVTTFIITPLFLLGFPLILSQTLGGEQEKRQTVGVIGLERLPAPLRTILEGQNGVKLIAVTETVPAIQRGDVDAVIKVPASGLPTVAGGKSIPLEIYAKLSNQRGNIIQRKIEDLIGSYSKSLVLTKLRQLNLPPDTLEPIVTKAVSADTVAEKAGGFFAFIFPMLLFISIIGGASTIAIDATAGEKERGSLEILLVSPVLRSEVVLGKLLATTLYALFTVTVQILAFVFTSAISPWVLATFAKKSGGEFAQLLGGNLNLGVAGFAQMMLIGVSVALMLSGLLVSICIYARSFKEAQTYLVPVQLVSQLVSVALQFGDFIARGTALYAVPIVGSVIGILDVVKGKSTAEMVLVIVLSNLVLAVLTALLALRNFRSEQVLFRN